MNLLNYVQKRLPKKRSDLEHVANKSGVPFNTLIKIADHTTRDPRVSTIQRLADYYRKLEEGNGKLKSALQPAEQETT